jgi:protein-S-isoprenylcysteine O-methyltransferase Ste14
MNFTDRSLIARIILITLLTVSSIAFFGLILFIFAWRINWFQAWAFLFIFGFVSLVTNLIAAINYPGMIDSRLARHAGVQKWDVIIVRILGLNTFVLLIAAGLDKGLLLLPSVPDLISLVALPFTSIYVIVQLWAAVVNEYFEGHVRLQADRQQTVIRTGPYKIVRHLFYATFILFWIATPLALGSFLALLPGAIGVIALIIRTAKEDRFLMENLPGYREYSQKVRYRLLPGVW